MRIFSKDTKILFADLDWTIIEPISGGTFANDIHDWKFKVGILDAIEHYNPTHLFIVSNQGGIQNGYQTYDEIVDKMKDICLALERELPGIEIDYAFCSTTSKKDHMRKPNTGMLEHFVGNCSFVKENALMIGDASGLPGQKRDCDKRCAENFGIDYLDVFDFIKEYGIM